MNTSDDTETALVMAARKGDRAAFGKLVRQHQRRAYAAAYSIVGNSDDALEIAQEAFVRAYRAIERFDPAMPFYPWLYRIVRNICLNHLRRRNRRSEVSLQDLMESGYDAQEDGRNPEEMAELDDLKRSIREAMARLSPEHQEILRLRHFLELSYAEIAHCLEIPQGTVMSRLHAARKGLREVLERHKKDLVTT
jgi:RNA polymerase sigma-70 factor (ECF subfamily)